MIDRRFQHNLPTATLRALSRCLVLVWAIGLSAIPLTPARAEPTENPNAATRPDPVVVSDGPVRVAVQLPAGELVSGNAFDVVMRIETTEGVQVSFPRPEDILSVFEVENVTSTDGDCTPPAICQTITLRLIAYFAGEYSLPPLPIVYYDDRRATLNNASDAQAQQFSTPEIPLKIEEGLADVRGPVAVAIPIEWRIVGLVAAIIAGLAIIGWIAKRYWPVSEDSVIAPPAPPPLPAYEWALQAFRQLEADDLIAIGRIKDFYVRVNGILRGYIEREFDFNAGEQTSEEFVRSLQDDGRFSSTQRELLRAFIDACDPVKYAAQTPAPDEISWVQKTARDFVERTHATREAERRAAAQRDEGNRAINPSQSEVSA